MAQTVNLDALAAQFKAQQMASNNASSSPNVPNLDDLANQFKAAQQQSPSPLANAVNSGFMGSLDAGMNQAVADVGTGVYNLGHRAVNAVRGLPAPTPIQANFAPYASNQAAFKAGQFIPYLVAPEVKAGQLALAGATKAAPLIGNALSKVAPYLTAGATGATYGTLNAANDPNASIGGNALESAALGAVTHGFGNVLSPVASLITQPLNTLKSSVGKYVNNALGKMQTEASNPAFATPLVSPAMAAQRLQQAANAPLSLGDLTGSPKLTGLYNSAVNVPLSAQLPKLQQKVGSANQAASDAMNALKGNLDPADMNKNIISALQNNYSAIQKASSNLYEAPRQMAMDAGLNTNSRPLTQAIAQNALDAMKSSQAKNELNWISKSPADQELLQTLAKGPSQSTVSDLGDALKTRSEIGQTLADARLAGNNQKASLYSDLYGSLSQDLENNISNSNSPALSQAWQTANDFYKNNVVPYQASNIRTLMNKDDTKNLTNTLLQPENSTVLSHFSPDDKRALAYQALNKSLTTTTDGTVEPVASKLWNNYAQLKAQNPNIENLLFSDADRANLQKAGSLYQMTASARPVINPPPTGYRLDKTLKNAATLGASGAGLGAAALGANAIGLPLAAIGTGAILGNRALANYLTNPNLLRAYTQTDPAVRNALVQQSLGYRAPGALTQGAQLGVNALRRLLNPAQIGRLVGQSSPQGN